MGRGRAARRADTAHDDLDLALEYRNLARFLHAMGGAGFRLLRDDGPFNRVLIDTAGRKVDYHVFDASATRLASPFTGRWGLEYRRFGVPLLPAHKRAR